MRARDIMTTPVHTIRQDAGIEDAAELLQQHRITALPVLDADGALVGMVSEGDLLWHRVPADPTAHAWRRLPDRSPRQPGTVHQVMSAHPVTVTPDADLADVADLLLQHDVRSVPVTDGRQVIGIVSRRDIMRATIRDDGTLTGEVQHRLDEYSDGVPRWTVAVRHGVAVVSGTFDGDVERTVVSILARTVPGVTAVELPGDASG